MRPCPCLPPLPPAALHATVAPVSLPDLRDADVLRALLAPIGLEPDRAGELIGADYGFASALARVALPERDHPVVVKAWNVETHGSAEITFYEEWAPRLPVRLAACFGGHADEVTGVLVLEDLGATRQGDAAEPIAAGDAGAIARDLGSIQAATAGQESSLDRVAAPRPTDWHESRRAAHLERQGAPAQPYLRRIVERSDRADALSSELLAGSVPGLVHGDVHADNVVYLADDTPVLLDWARPQWGPAAHAVASLLLGTERAGYAGVIAAFRSRAALSDDEIHGAMLRRLVTATLGTVVWQPKTERQHRLVEAGLAQAAAAATWLADEAPDVLAALGG